MLCALRRAPVHTCAPCGLPRIRSLRAPRPLAVGRNRSLVIPFRAWKGEGRPACGLTPAPPADARRYAKNYKEQARSESSGKLLLHCTAGRPAPAPATAAARLCAGGARADHGRHPHARARAGEAPPPVLSVAPQRSAALTNERVGGQRAAFPDARRLHASSSLRASVLSRAHVHAGRPVVYRARSGFHISLTVQDSSAALVLRLAGSTALGAARSWLHVRGADLERRSRPASDAKGRADVVNGGTRAFASPPPLSSPGVAGAVASPCCRSQGGRRTAASVAYRALMGANNDWCGCGKSEDAGGRATRWFAHPSELRRRAVAPAMQAGGPHLLCFRPAPPNGPLPAAAALSAAIACAAPAPASGTRRCARAEQRTEREETRAADGTQSATETDAPVADSVPLARTSRTPLRGACSYGGATWCSNAPVAAAAAAARLCFLFFLIGECDIVVVELLGPCG